MKYTNQDNKICAFYVTDRLLDILNLEKRIPELVQRINDLVKVNEAHQKLNGELREDNKKLAQQVDDYTNQLRKAGVI